MAWGAHYRQAEASYEEDYLRKKRLAGTPVYLPTVGASPLLVLSTAKLVQGVTNAYRVQRLSDSAKIDIPFGGQYASASAVAQARGASTISLETFYDQLGLNDYTNATQANQPFVSDEAVFNGAPAISWDSLSGLTTGNVSKLLSNAAGPAVDSRNFTVFMVVAPHYSFGNGHSYWSAPANNNHESIYTVSTGGVGLIGRAGSQVKAVSGLVPKAAGTNIIAFKADATHESYRLNGTKVDVVNVPAVTSALGFVIGSGAGNGVTYDGRFDLMAFVAYPYLSDADCATVEAALAANFPVITNQTTKLIGMGDSRCQGMGGGFNPWWRQLTRGLSKEVYSVNMGVGGVTMETMAANAAAWFTSQYDASRARNIFIFGAGPGINSFNADVLATTVETSFQTIATACRATNASSRIIAETCLQSSSMSAPRLAELNAYNTWLRANWATYADALIDLDAIPAISTWSSTYYWDFAHGKQAWHDILGAAHIPVVNGFVL